MRSTIDRKPFERWGVKCSFTLVVPVGEEWRPQGVCLYPKMLFSNNTVPGTQTQIHDAAFKSAGDHSCVLFSTQLATLRRIIDLIFFKGEG
jgi:hypothetical protein